MTMTVYLGLGLALAASGALNIILLSVLGRRMREDADERDLDWARAPHGRLIDADALKDQLKARRCSPCKRTGSMCWACWVHDAETEIDDAPTVLPAEPCKNLSKPFNDDVDIPICTKASLASLGIYKKAEEAET